MAGATIDALFRCAEVADFRLLGHAGMSFDLPVIGILRPFEAIINQDVRLEAADHFDQFMAFQFLGSVRPGAVKPDYINLAIIGK